MSAWYSSTDGVKCTAMTTSEDKCCRCGRCCYVAVPVCGEMWRTNTPCGHLDLETRQCKVYDLRFAVNPRCLTILQAIREKMLPTDCPYVAGRPGYRGPKEVWREIDEADEEAAKDITRPGGVTGSPD